MQPLKLAYSITHALPGRVGFCIPRITQDPKYIKRLQALLKGEALVADAQFNIAAGSIVITYDGIISDSEMRSRLADLIESANTIPCSIAHALPGRVRFHVPEVAVDPKYVQRLETLLKADTCVTSERVNSAAASVIITYKPEAIPDAEIHSHLASLIQYASQI